MTVWPTVPRPPRAAAARSMALPDRALVPIFCGGGVER